MLRSFTFQTPPLRLFFLLLDFKRLPLRLPSPSLIMTVTLSNSETPFWHLYSLCVYNIPLQHYNSIKLTPQYMMNTRKTIAQIISMAARTGPDDHSYTVVCKIDSIYEHVGWCYVTCYQCSKKLHAANGLFWCKMCDAPCRYPLIRIHLCVGDPTGGAIFTITNRLAERILDCSAQQFYHKLHLDDFPPPVIGLVGRYFAFRICLPNYANEDTDYHNYRVLDMWEFDRLPDFISSGSVKVGGSNKSAIPGGCGPSEPGSAGSTSEAGANLGIPTPEKKSAKNKRKRGG